MRGSNRRKWACALLIVAMLAAGYVGLAANAKAALGPGPHPAATSVLRVGETQQPDSLNPFVGVESTSYIVWAHVYELLVGIGPDTTPIPALAKSWSVNPTGLIWTFHLQNNVTWQDGTPFTSADVNFTFRYIYKQTPYNPIGCDLTLLEGYLGDYDTRTGVDVGNITTPDAYTVVIPTYQPKANILAMFIPIIPQHIWGGIACNKVLHVNPTPMVGTGMYSFVTWVQGAYVQLNLNPNYWRLDKSQVNSYVQEILIEFYSTTSAMYDDFKSGAIDATDALSAQLFLQVPPNVQGSATPNVGFFKVRSMSMSEMGACLASDALIAQYGVKGGRNWLVTNQTIRQAMQLAVNRSFLVDNILGTGAAGSGLGDPGSTLIPLGTPFWHLNVTGSDSLNFNPAEARLLLDDPAGNGMTVLPGHNNDPGPYGQYLDPAAANNSDAFAAINPSYPNVRVPIDPSRVGTGDVWGATGGTSAPNRPAPYPLIFVLDVINTDDDESNAADRMIQWWADVGIQVTKNLIPESKMISVTYACSEDLYMWGWGMDVDPDFALSVMTTPQILYWQDAWYSNATYDQWYGLQQTQVDPYQRQQTIWNMQQKLYEDGAYLIMWYPFSITVVRTDTFSGWTGLGDWSQHPGLGLTGFGNDLVMLTVRAGSSAPPTNNCPTQPVISPSGSITTFVNASTVFQGTSTDPDPNQNLTWTWSWGDNNVTQTRNSTSVTEQLASHVWTQPGTYFVNLTVTDGICTPETTASPTQVNVIPSSGQIGWIVGHVTESLANQPLANVSVVATPGGFSAVSSLQGAYNITLPPGTYTVTATRSLYNAASQASVAVTNGTATTVDLVLTFRAGWIAGTVRSAAGAALAGAVVYMVGPQEYVVRTDAAGGYNRSVLPGTYSVNASYTGYVTVTYDNKTVSALATTTVDFTLQPVPQPASGLSPLEVAAVAVVVIAAVGALAYLVIRRRREAEKIEGPELPPKPPSGG